MWPSIDENRGGMDMLCCSNSVRKLTLELQVKKINFSVLQSLFPRVTSLEIRGKQKHSNETGLTAFVTNISVLAGPCRTEDYWSEKFSTAQLR